jgi:hypothetical protein
MRKTDSILNRWISEQPSTREEVAKQLKVSYGQLMMWLVKGFVPKPQMKNISKKTGIAIEALMLEYNSVKNNH